MSASIRLVWLIEHHSSFGLILTKHSNIFRKIQSTRTMYACYVRWIQWIHSSVFWGKWTICNVMAYSASQRHLTSVQLVPRKKQTTCVSLYIVCFHMIAHVWQAYSMGNKCISNHMTFFDVSIRKTLRHNVELLQKQTISRESFKTV